MNSQETVIKIPEKIAERARELGIDINNIVIDALAERLGIDPEEELEARAELARKYLEEGARLADRDPVQASEKLYKAVEEAVKAAAKIIGLTSALSSVRDRGIWTATDLEKVVEILSKSYGDQVILWWGTALALHV